MCAFDMHDELSKQSLAFSLHIGVVTSSQWISPATYFHLQTGCEGMWKSGHNYNQHNVCLSKSVCNHLCVDCDNEHQLESHLYELLSPLLKLVYFAPGGNV